MPYEPAAATGRHLLNGLIPIALAFVGALASRTASSSEIMGALPPASLSAAKQHAKPLVVLPRPALVRPVEHARAHECNGRCGKDGCGQQGCPAVCPVRPGEFGFYGTQWRTWPGQGMVKQAGYNEAATPVSPPKSEVPTADEESPAADEEPVAPEPEAPAEKSQEDEAPEAKPLPPEEEARPSKPAAKPPAEETPAEETPATEKAPPAKNLDNLFDEAALRRRHYERLVAAQQTAVLRERMRQEALREQASSGRPPRPQPIDPLPIHPLRSGNLRNDSPPIHPLRKDIGSGVMKASHEQPAAHLNPVNPVNPLR
jgi:hypothetical protein